MASEIRVDKINSLSGVGTVTLSPTGVDIAGITTAATLRATTGIVTSLTAGSLTSLGDVDIADTIVHTGDTNTKIRFPAADTVTIETGGSERIRVTSDGHFGIGDTTPAELLTLRDATPRIRLEDSDTTNAACQFVGDNASVLIQADTSGVVNDSTISFAIDGGEVARLDSSGRVLIGDTDVDNSWSGGDSVVIGKTSSGTRTGVTLVSANDQDSGIYFSDGTSSGSANVQGQIVYNHSTSNLSLYTTATEKIRINSSGDILYANNDRNYASWYKIPTNSSSNSATSNTEDLIFGTAVIANTDVYNTSNGRYTAPVDGLYHIRFNGLIDNNAGQAGFQVLMRKNGSTYGAQIAYQTRLSDDSPNRYQLISGTGIMYMSAGDYATIYATAGMHTSNECNYIVYLIRGTV